MKTTIFAFSLALLASLTAHSAENTFKMYEVEAPTVNEGCDRFTQLVIDVDGSYGTATLTDHLRGACDLHVPENKRTYSLRAIGDDCGSTIYQQNTFFDLDIEISDNRNRACRDRVPKITLIENRNNMTLRLYSQEY